MVCTRHHSSDLAWRRLRLGLLLSLLVNPGCTTAAERTQVQIRLVGVTSATADPFAGVAYLRMTVSGEGIDPSLVQTFAIGSKSGRIGGIPFGKQRRILIEGLQGTPDGPVVSRGVTMPFDVTASSSAERDVLFAPVNTFSETIVLTSKKPSGLLADRIGASIAELPDGRVLITGGATLSPEGDLATVHNTALIYDPASGAFESLPNKLSFSRAFHTSSVLADGTILLIGGVTLINNQPDAVRPCEIYDSGLAQFITGATLNVARAYHTATTLNDGSIVVIGGLVPGANATTLKSVERFDPTLGRFTTLNDLNQERAHHTATLDPADGQSIIVIGGSSNKLALSSTEIYESPALGGRATLGPVLAKARVFHTATILVDAKMIAIIGGFPDESLPQAESSIEFFSFLEKKLLSTQASLAAPRAHHVVVSLDGRTLLVVGGQIGSGIVPEVEVVTASGQSDVSVTKIVGAPVAPRAMGVAIRLRTDNILIIGGIASATSMLGERRGELFTPGL